MNDLQIFKSEEFGEVRTVTIDNEPWFVGKDIAEKLGYVDTAKAIVMHVSEDDRKALKYKAYDKMSEAKLWSGNDFSDKTIINESGVYTLIFGSKLEKAKEFKHWVTSEVLPSIRKHGGYISGQEKLPTAEKEKLLAEIASLKDKVELLDEMYEQEQALTEELKKENTKLAYNNERMKLQLDCDAHNMTLGEYSKYLKETGCCTIPRNCLFEYFRTSGYISKEKETWNKPNKYCLDAFTAREYLWNGETKYQPLITPFGQGFFALELRAVAKHIKRDYQIKRRRDER